MGGLLGGTSYGNGSRTTQTNVAPVPQTVPMGANMEGIYDLFRRMTRGNSQPRSSTPLLGGYRSVANRPDYGNRPTESYNPLAGMQRESQALQMQAANNPAPQRMTQFASNANNFYTPDVNAMNAYQRQIYLPGNAAGGVIPGLAAGDNGLSSDQESIMWRIANGQ